VRIIRRVFTTVDAAGNSASQTQTIFLLRGELRDIQFPRDTIISCLDEADLSPDFLGSPQVGSCDQFEISTQDIEVEVCGVARKILRRWQVTDICSRSDTIVTQVIEIVDDTAPTFDFSNFDIPIDRVQSSKFNCTSSIIGINNPQIKDCNLAQTTLGIFYQLSDPNGNLFGAAVSAVVNDMISDPDDPNTATMVWDLIDVPVDEDFRVIFVADDGCGNISRDTSDIFRLPDTSPPNAVCEGNTTVVLGQDGTTKLLAVSLDDNSFDNCGIVNRQGRRFDSSCPDRTEDLTFGDEIFFCCSDIANNPVKVVFRVYDAAGGFSDCIVNVIVQDKRMIDITCGPPLTFNCGTDSVSIINTIMLNPPSVVFVCGEESLTPNIPSFTEDECGGASFNVEWTAMDINGQIATCVQSVNIGNLVEATVVRPMLEISLTSCAGGLDPDDIPGSRPTVNDVDCEVIAPTWEDEIFEGENGACIRIVRTWTIIDWCRFNGGFVNEGIIDQFEQTILVDDTVDPVIQCPETIVRHRLT